MTHTTLQCRVVFGVVPMRLILPTPIGKVRIRMRSTCAAIAYVRDESGITAYWLKDLHDHWELGRPVGANAHPVMGRLEH